MNTQKHKKRHHNNERQLQRAQSANQLLHFEWLASLMHVISPEISGQKESLLSGGGGGGTPL